MAAKNSYLGVDLGGAGIKLVELKNVSHRPQLVTYGMIDETYNIVKDESVEAVRGVAGQLKELVKQSRVTTDLAVAALPSFSVFSSIISLPVMNKKDMESAVRWEAKKFVPIPLEEMILDWEIMQTKAEEKESKEDKTKVDATEDEKNEKQAKEDAEKKETGTKVVLTAAPKNLVNRYVALFKEAGLRLQGLETESFAVERSLIGNDPNPIMVIDVGSQVTNVTIFIDGVPILNRSIDVGGATATKTMANTMNIPEEQAEQFKRDMTQAVSEYAMDDLPRPVKYLVNSIVNEIRYIFNIYQGQHKKPITKVVLTGGSATLTNLSTYIEKLFNLKAFVGDPWARVVRPVDIDGLLKGIGPRMSVAIGLAMREIE